LDDGTHWAFKRQFDAMIRELMMEASAPLMIDVMVEGAQAWTRDTLQEADWKIPISSDCLAELARVGEELKHHPLPTVLLIPDDYPLDACRVLMQTVRTRLDDGPGVVVLDRLPVEQYDLSEITNLFWLLGSLIARPVAQTIDGQMMVDVRDTGVPKAVGVRGFRTNVAQLAHVDNGFNHTPPDYVSLCCLHKALLGGVSQFVSFYTVHNRLLLNHSDLLPRLYQPFYQDRQGDFWPGESQTVFYPVFTLNPSLRCRFSHFTIPAGYQTAGVEMDPQGKAAFETMTGIIEDPSLYCEFTIEPGQLQFVNNRWCGHGRTGYTDYTAPEQRRHLLRLWHRDWGRRTYSGLR
jgi:alpha-ketoglutarate-dependent taurine dioxygenase